MPNLKRRYIVLGTAGAVGALMIGWAATPQRRRLMTDKPLALSQGQVALNGWVKVSADNTVTVMMSQAEMGQGAQTGLAMLLAEEMDADWTQVTLEQSTLDAIYNNQAVIIDGLPFQPNDHGLMKRATGHVLGKIIRAVPGLQGTGGSSSVADQWLPLREAGASARAMLIGAAAALWRVPAGECRAENGRVLHPSGKSAAFGELAQRAAQLPLPQDVTLKTSAQFKLIGHPVRRIDNAAKLDGSATYGIDVLLPGLLYASISMCPTVGGKVAGFDAAAAQAMPGVRKVVKLEPAKASSIMPGSTCGGVAVIADTPFRAMRALAQVAIEWDHGAAAALSSETISSDLRAALDGKDGTVHFQHRPRRGRIEIGSQDHRSGIPRAVSRARDHGAHELHSAIQGRRGNRVGPHSGGRICQRRRGQGAGHFGVESRHQGTVPRRRVRPALSLGLHRASGAAGA